MSLKTISIKLMVYGVLLFTPLCNSLSLWAQEPGTIKKTEILTDTFSSSSFGFFVKQYNDTSFVVSSRKSSQSVLNFFRLSNNEVSSVFRISRNMGGFGDFDISDNTFGNSMEVLNDINGDGILRDIVVGTPSANGFWLNSGGLWFLSLNEEGEVIKQRRLADTTPGLGHLNNSTYFGFSIANLGDIDGNGYDDIAVGAPLQNTSSSDNGSVYIILLEKDGAIKSLSRINDSHFFITRSLRGFGYSVVNMGDIDGDGINDLAVSEASNRTIWLLLMNADGTLKGTREISPGKNGLPASMDLTSNFGRCITNMGDMDGDGVSELAIGEQTYVPEDSTGVMHGRVWIFFFDSNGSVKKTIEIKNQTPGFTGNISDRDRFGYAVARIPDMDGDGAPELAIGVPASEPNGKVYILYLNGIPQTGISTPKPEHLSATLYPNPAQNHVQLALEPAPKSRFVVSVWSLNGQKVWEWNLEPQPNSYSLTLPATLNTGIYFFKIQTPSGTLVKKVGIH